MAETRKLAAILAADVAGYSRLAGADEERTLARLRALRSDLIDPTIALHHGRVVKRTGDGVLIEFRSVVDAVRCAIEVQNGMVERNVGLPPERRIEFRVGIHLGDVVEETDGDLMGDGVNIAARLEAIAEPGGICLSEDAYRQVRDRLKEGFTDLGDRELKNIARPVRVYQVLWTGTVRSEPIEPTAASTILALPDKPSIAVLPFQNMGSDPEQEYFADGMVEEIITGLARIKWLFVIARNSSFAYKGKSPDIRQVGRELGVRYVLEGSVRKAGNRVRITGQLIEAENGAHVWADKFEGGLEDVFEVQDKVTDAVVGIIEPNVQRAEIDRARRKRPESLGAYDLYLRALPYFRSIMPADANIGVSLLEQALKLDPSYAPAHAYMAWAMEIRFIRAGFNDEADKIEGERHARLALAHGSDDSMALSVAALVILHLGNDFDAASAAISRALSLNPSCAAAFYWGAHIHGFSGDLAIAEDYAHRALRLSPFDPVSFNAYLSLGCVRARQRHFDDAAAFFARAVQINPRFNSLYAFQIAALAMIDRTDEAKSVAKRLLELEPNFRIGPIFVSLVFLHPELLNWLAEGLRKAGLPEG
jgi:adenylate cyclase